MPDGHPASVPASAPDAAPDGMGHSASTISKPVTEGMRLSPPHDTSSSAAVNMATIRFTAYALRPTYICAMPRQSERRRHSAKPTPRMISRKRSGAGNSSIEAGR